MNEFLFLLLGLVGNHGAGGGGAGRCTFTIAAGLTGLQTFDMLALQTHSALRCWFGAPFYKKLRISLNK